MVIIGWIGPKINGLDLGSGFDPNRFWVRPKVNGLDLGSEFDPKFNGLKYVEL